MKKILYLECNSGISGDMTVGALLDLGADQKELERVLDSMKVNGYHLHFGRKVTCGLDAFDFDVHLEHEHSHDHEHDHDHEHSHDHEHVHDHTHSHAHEHSHAHTHGHEHRNLHDVYAIIDRLDTNEHVKNLARKMFLIVAEAESKAHGLPIEQVHFHEVGAIDSIIDIVSTAVCVDNLGVDEVVVSPLAEGRGYVRCQHGVIPVPVPATANIAAAYDLEFRFTENDGEMVTPTGAAIAAALSTGKKLPTGCRIRKTGMGAGNKEFRQANVLRAMLLEEEETPEPRLIEKPSGMWVLETNLDDCTGEMLGFVMELLFEAGAADVWYTPIYMKKNRPAYMLSVLCDSQRREQLEELIFANTTTIGIRRSPAERTVLERRKTTVDTKFGPVEVKLCTHKGNTYCYPEYESVKAVCQEMGQNYRRVYGEAEQAARKQNSQEEE